MGQAAYQVGSPVIGLDTVMEFQDGARTDGVYRPGVFMMKATVQGGRFRGRILHPIELYMTIWSDARLCKYLSVYRATLAEFIRWLDMERGETRIVRRV